MVVHAITSTSGAGYVSDEDILSQIDVLNEDFQALAGSLGEPGFDSRIKFALAKRRPDGSPTTGIERYQNNTYYNDSFSTKPDLHWDTNLYFNIYVNNPGQGLLGYATFPVESAGDNDDGVVIGWEFFGRNAPNGGNYNLGRTATHEVGHYFGLYHTFQDGCGSEAAPYTTGDRIADTNAEQQPTFGCPQNQSTCGSPDPVHNYMDYSYDICMDNFTPEQINRMRCSITNYRAQLFNATPQVSFVVNGDGLVLDFLSNAIDSDGTVDEYLWDFGDGGSSTEPNPEHSFADYGTYTVSLTVTDNRGGQTTVTEQVLVNGFVGLLVHLLHTRDALVDLLVQVVELIDALVDRCVHAAELLADIFDDAASGHTDMLLGGVNVCLKVLGLFDLGHEGLGRVGDGVTQRLKVLRTAVDLTLGLLKRNKLVGDSLLEAFDLIGQSRDAGVGDRRFAGGR